MNFGTKVWGCQTTAKGFAALVNNYLKYESECS